ncbi:MAG: hypothetical protein PHU03_03560 [Syntrophales bacterium]|nr:hypothetical protein [Syntrophales bacterium]
MKKSRFIVLLTLSLPFLLGMGMSTANIVAEDIPMPAKEFSAVFLDQMDTATECYNVSIEGKTFFEGRHGKGFYIVPFENIESVFFLMKNEVLTASIAMKQEQGFVELKLNPDLRVFGRTRWGTFQIRMGDLKSIRMNVTSGG